MTPDTTSPPSGDTLQFDRAIPAGADGDAHQSHPSCSACSHPISTFYFTLEGQTLCSGCKRTVEQQTAPVREWSLILRAALFGLGAAIVGAGIYYGVIAITEFEIGLVAILIGYMVGHAVRKGARGRGGLRLQLTAVFLTYLAVAMAYVPLAIRGAAAGTAANDNSVLVDDSPAIATATQPDEGDAAEPAVAGSDSAVASATQIGVVPGLGLLLILTLGLPVLVVLGSMPSGLISALIIGIGMRQAWIMTGSARLTIQGPFRVGAGPSEAEARPSLG